VSAFQRNFLNKVRRCNEMEREIRFFEHQLSAEVKDMMAGKKWIYQFFKMVYGRRKQRNKLTDLEKEDKEMNEKSRETQPKS